MAPRVASGSPGVCAACVDPPRVLHRAWLPPPPPGGCAHPPLQPCLWGGLCGKGEAARKVRRGGQLRFILLYFLLQRRLRKEERGMVQSGVLPPPRHRKFGGRGEGVAELNGERSNVPREPLPTLGCCGSGKRSAKPRVTGFVLSL